MDLKVNQDTYNPLLKRKELSVEVEHENAGSPSRVSLREAVASKFSTKTENVFVLEIATRTGSQSSICEIQVYDDPDTAKKIVPKHIQIRNLPSAERKKIKESKKAEEPKAEKPKAQKPAEVKPEKPKAEAAPVKEQKVAEAKPPPAKDQKATETKPAEASKGKGKTKEGESK